MNDDGGYPLLEAAWRFAKDRQTASQFRALWWRSQIIGDHPDQLTLEEHEMLVDLQSEVEADLLSGLRTGDLSAAWIPSSGEQPKGIHRLWWGMAWVDLRLNQAQVGETVLTRIRVFAPDASLQVTSVEQGAASASPRPIRFAGRPTKSRSLIEAQMRARAAQGTIHLRLAAEVRHLLCWLEEHHPEEERPSQSGVENNLRSLFRDVTKSLK